MKGRKGLAHDVMFTSSTYAGIVHEVTKTARWKRAATVVVSFFYFFFF